MSSARKFIRLVADDGGLPHRARREAASLETLAASKPAVVFKRLESLRQRVVPDLPTSPPQRDYSRCVTADAFWEFHIRPARREMFAHGEEYRRHLEAHVDPAAAALADLPGSGTLVPAAHSWLVPADRISGLTGRQTKALLSINENPPYLVMEFPVAAMQAAGVAVREPRGLDAVPKRHDQWSAGDVPDERIDLDIPATALGSLGWRP